MYPYTGRRTLFTGGPALYMSSQQFFNCCKIFSDLCFLSVVCATDLASLSIAYACGFYCSLTPTCSLDLMLRGVNTSSSGSKEYGGVHRAGQNQPGRVEQLRPGFRVCDTYNSRSCLYFGTLHPASHLFRSFILSIPSLSPSIIVCTFWTAISRVHTIIPTTPDYVYLG
jgi:hypothetical protein